MVPSWVIPHLNLGILQRALEPISYSQLTPLVSKIARVLDELALAGTMATAVIAMVRLRSVRPAAQKVSLVLYVLLLVAMTRMGFWSSAYSFSRPFGPLFVLPMAGDRPRTALMLALLVDLRVLAEFQSQALHVVQWLAGG